MGDTLDHTLFNPNQLRNYGNRFQDNLISESPLSMIAEDGEFITELSIEETFLLITHTPSDEKLGECPNINISSTHPWHLMKVCFPKWYQSL